MANEKKTNIPLLICVIAFFLGMIIAGWGWDKDTSTIASRVPGGAAMIWIGGIMIVAGLIGMFTMGNRKSNR